MSYNFSQHSNSMQERLARLFGEKMVVKLACRFCSAQLCSRGMKALLLADTKTELYSTDIPPLHATSLIGDDYQTPNCDCRIGDVGCLCCGNVVGYHVTQPCQSCLKACNNGHMWMFSSNAVLPMERSDPEGKTYLSWSTLLSSSEPANAPPSPIARALECAR